MASYNRVVLVGNLTRDVELRYTPQGTAVTDVAANFFDVTLWGRTAEVAGEYLSKGSSILIEGRLKLDRWEQDGQKRSKVKIVGERMQMLGGRGGGGGGGSSSGGSASSNNSPQNSNQNPQQAQEPSQGPPPADEVPF